MSFGCLASPIRGGTLTTSLEQTDCGGLRTEKRLQLAKAATANIFPLRAGEGDRGRGQGDVLGQAAGARAGGEPTPRADTPTP